MSVLGRLIAASVAQRSLARRRAAWVLAVLGPVVFTLGTLPLRPSLGLQAVRFLTLLVAAVVSVIGGVRPGAMAVAGGALLSAFFDSRPYESFRLTRSDDAVGLAIFLVVGVAVAVLIDKLARLIREQAALRRVATLVARGAPPPELFALATEEVGRVLAAEVAHLDRFEDDGSLTVLAAWSEEGDHLPAVGSRCVIGGDNLSTRICQTCRPARIDSYAEASGPTGVAARAAGHRSAVGTPIVVDGTLWGAMSVVSLRERPLPADTETRLAAFTEMLAAAIADAKSRVDLACLAERQAALRRVATLVARAAPPEEVFAAVTEEVGRRPAVEIAQLARYECDGTVTFLAGWSSEGDALPAGGTRMELGGENVVTLVSRTGRPIRFDSYADASGPIGVAARELGRRSSIGVPIIVEGRLWGVLSAGSNLEQPLPHDGEARLADFADLLATAIANAARRADIDRLAEEQSALRRVATLVAGGAPARDVFVAVTEEVGRLFPVDSAGMGRYESDGTVTFIASWSREGPPEVQPGSRLALGGKNLSTLVARTSAPSRIDWDHDASGQIGSAFRGSGFRSGVGTPIIVEGRLWGLIIAGSKKEQPLPSDLEARLGRFTELVATAVANAESRAGLARLAEEQAALRRVATLVARGAPHEEVFARVTEEVGQLLPVDRATLSHYDSSGALTIVTAWSPGGSHPAPAAVSGANNGLTRVSKGRLPARAEEPEGIADGSAAVGLAGAGKLRDQVATPIVVDGRPWGVMSAGSVSEQALPPDTEARLASFTDLLATAIANADSRRELTALAEEQAALRRVATLVARGVPPEQLFQAVAEEAGQLLGVELAGLGRYHSEDSVTFLAGWRRGEGTLDVVGTTLPVEGGDVPTLVWRTGRPARIDRAAGDASPIGLARGEASLHSVVGAPIVVEGRLWGFVAAGSTRPEEPLPPDTEARLSAFTDLLATAIANADSRAELAASRARIAAAADETRRRIERDLHDGAQQRLVALSLELRAAQAALPPGLDALDAELDRIAAGLTWVQELLRQIARGIHPAILAHGGLRAALKSLARQSPIPVKLKARGGLRLHERVEVAAYYVVSEALTNAAKHSGASVVDVEVCVARGVLRLHIHDDGVGGADPARGSGLLGLKDRVETLGGTVSVESRVGAGTSLRVEIPVGD